MNPKSLSPLDDLNDYFMWVSSLSASEVTALDCLPEFYYFGMVLLEGVFQSI
jgi:hypothetical protein